MNWLKGKKTYISAGALAVLGVGLVVLRQPALGVQAICLGAGLAGLGDRANRHQAEILQTIQNAVRIATDAKAGNKAALAVDISAAAGQALGFATGGVVSNSAPAVGAQSTDLAIPAPLAQQIAGVVASTKFESPTGNAALPAAGAGESH